MKINLSHNIQHSKENTTEEKLNLTTLTLSLYFTATDLIFFYSEFFSFLYTYETLSNDFSRL